VIRGALSAVMAGLVPAIHVLLAAQKTWMPATSAGMTTDGFLHGGGRGGLPPRIPVPAR